jgi:hypothetical protein
MSGIAQKIVQIFGNSVKKNQLLISNSSGVINFLMDSCNPAFLVLTEGCPKLKN